MFGCEGFEGVLCRELLLAARMKVEIGRDWGQMVRYMCLILDYSRYSISLLINSFPHSNIYTLETSQVSRRRGGSPQGQLPRASHGNRFPGVIDPQLPRGDPPFLVGFPPTLFPFQPLLVGNLSLLCRLSLPGPTRLPFQEFLVSDRAVTNAVVVITAVETGLAIFAGVPEIWLAERIWV